VGGVALGWPMICGWRVHVFWWVSWCTVVFGVAGGNLFGGWLWYLFLQEAGASVAFVGGGARGARSALAWQAGVFGAGSWYLCRGGSNYGVVAAL
jgi:hypothetical protein